MRHGRSGRNEMVRTKSSRRSVVALLTACVTAGLVAGVSAVASATNPQISLSISTGSPGVTVTVDGSGFAHSEQLTLSFSHPPDSLGHITTDSNGAFPHTVDVVVPITAIPGPQSITAAGDHDSAQANFTVNTDWPQFHLSAPKHGANKVENIVVGQRVTVLVPAGAQEVAGNVTTSPAVVGNEVYVTTNTGKLYGLGGAQRGLAKDFGPISVGTGRLTAPAVQDGVVYVGSEDGHLYARNATNGNDLWAVPTGHTIDAPPTIDGQTVYVGNSAGQMWAITIGGLTLWHYDDAAPIVGGAAVDDGSVFFGDTDGNLYSLDASSGAVNWQVSISPAITMPISTTPAVGVPLNDEGEGSAKTVFITTGVDGSDPPHPHVMAYWAGNGELRWDHTLNLDGDQTGLTSSPALDERTESLNNPSQLYFGTKAGAICALDATDGTTLNGYQVPGHYGADSSPVTVGYGGPGDDVGDMVFIGGNDGRIYAVKEASNGVFNPKWNSVPPTSDEHLNGSIAVSNGYVYYGVAKGEGMGEVYALTPYDQAVTLSTYEETVPDGGQSPVCGSG
jgi:eukaryotic-like serine/threonine-protein kinase